MSADRAQVWAVKSRLPAIVKRERHLDACLTEYRTVEGPDGGVQRGPLGEWRQGEERRVEKIKCDCDGTRNLVYNPGRKAVSYRPILPLAV